MIEKVSVLSVYRNWLRTSACQIAVFLDNKSSYNYVKDIQSCGAAIQNMLLCAYSLGIGSCWIGEILPNAKIVKKLCGIENDDYELMAVIALGYYDTPIIQGERKAKEEFLI